MIHSFKQFGWHYHERRTALSLLSHLKTIETEAQLPWAFRSFMQTLLSLMEVTHDDPKAKTEYKILERIV